MLAVRDLTVRYDGVPALRDVSFDVGEGEFVGLIGPNGAGKSTTLRTIVGVARDRSGSVRFRGEELLSRRPEEILGLGIALVPEGRRIFGTLTVGENLRLAQQASGGGLRPRTVESVLERYPVLRRYWDSGAALLSGGEQQQLAIGRALLCGPDLLLLDEPSLGLSPLLTEQMFESLRELREEGVTILLVEQKASQTVELADRCYALRSGEIVLAGSREELRDLPTLAETYLGG